MSHSVFRPSSGMRPTPPSSKKRVPSTNNQLHESLKNTMRCSTPPTIPPCAERIDALIRDTKEQWMYAQRALGIRMTLVEDQPYRSAKDLFWDVTMNRHIGVWRGEGDMP